MILIKEDRRSRSRECRELDGDGSMLEDPVDSLTRDESRKILATSNSISLVKTTTDSCLSCGLSARKESLRKPCMEPVSLLSPYLYTSIYSAVIYRVSLVYLIFLLAIRIAVKIQHSCTWTALEYEVKSIGKHWTKSLCVKIPEWYRIFYSPLLFKE